MTQKYTLNANGPERGQVLANAHAFIDRLPLDKAWVIEVSPFVNKRSKKQRGSLFGVAYKAIMEATGLQGAQDKKDLHQFFCEEYFGFVEATGISPRRPKRTTTKNAQGDRDEISTVDALDMYAFIQRRAAENGIDVPDPDPMYAQRERLAA
jgi:hypothetical protein